MEAQLDADDDDIPLSKLTSFKLEKTDEEKTTAHSPSSTTTDESPDIKPDYSELSTATLLTAKEEPTQKIEPIEIEETVEEEHQLPAIRPAHCVLKAPMPLNVLGPCLPEELTAAQRSPWVVHLNTTYMDPLLIITSTTGGKFSNGNVYSKISDLKRGPCSEALDLSAKRKRCSVEVEEGSADEGSNNELIIDECGALDLSVKCDKPLSLVKAKAKATENSNVWKAQDEPINYSKPNSVSVDVGNQPPPPPPPLLHRDFAYGSAIMGRRVDSGTRESNNPTQTNYRPAERRASPADAYTSKYTGWISPDHRTVHKSTKPQSMQRTVTAQIHTPPVHHKIDNGNQQIQASSHKTHERSRPSHPTNRPSNSRRAELHPMPPAYMPAKMKMAVPQLSEQPRLPTAGEQLRVDQLRAEQIRAAQRLSLANDSPDRPNPDSSNRARNTSKSLVPRENLLTTAQRLANVSHKAPSSTTLPSSRLLQYQRRLAASNKASAALPDYRLPQNRNLAGPAERHYPRVEQRMPLVRHNSMERDRREPSKLEIDLTRDDDSRSTGYLSHSKPRPGGPLGGAYQQEYERSRMRLISPNHPNNRVNPSNRLHSPSYPTHSTSANSLGALKMRSEASAMLHSPNHPLGSPRLHSPGLSQNVNKMYNPGQQRMHSPGYNSNSSSIGSPNPAMRALTRVHSPNYGARDSQTKEGMHSSPPKYTDYHRHVDPNYTHDLSAQRNMASREVEYKQRSAPVAHRAGSKQYPELRHQSHQVRIIIII